jgi:hypothetical protein
MGVHRSERLHSGHAQRSPHSGGGDQGGLFMRHGFRATGEASLAGARIGMDVPCEGGRFLNEGGKALSLERARVGRNAFLCSPSCAVKGVGSGVIRGGCVIMGQNRHYVSLCFLGGSGGEGAVCRAGCAVSDAVC